MNSLLSAFIAEQFYLSKIFHSLTRVQRAVRDEKSQFKAEVDSFAEFKTSDEITFVLCELHSHFDDLIKLDNLRYLKFN